MKYIGTMVVDKATAEDMEAICANPSDSVRKNGVEFDREHIFANGMRLAVQVCASSTPTVESCWTQGVLFTPEGTELGCTDVGETFLGEYTITDNGDEYTVNVVSGGERDEE